MKRFFAILCVLCIAFSSCYAVETSIHNLWDLDLNNMNVHQVHDYLDQEKGIQSKVNDRYKTLNSLDNQEITLLGYPFSISYGQYQKCNILDLYFRVVGNRDDAITIINAMIDKYGEPTLIYYDMYNKSDLEWEYNIGEPMYHQSRKIESIADFDMCETLLNWEHYEESEYHWGSITVYLYIDNIRIQIECNDSNIYSMTVSFYSMIPSVQIEEVDESKNVPNYTDTGF